MIYFYNPITHSIERGNEEIALLTVRISSSEAFSLADMLNNHLAIVRDMQTTILNLRNKLESEANPELL